MKNVCQSCILDLQYGLPVEVRDTYLASSDRTTGQSDANREWKAQLAAKALENGTGSSVGKSHTKSLMKLVRAAPYYTKQKGAHLCQLFMKGECKRGKECEHVHHLSGRIKDVSSNSNVSDRYFGEHDPVTERLLGIDTTAVPPPPSIPPPPTMPPPPSSPPTEEAEEE